MRADVRPSFGIAASSFLLLVALLSMTSCSGGQEDASTAGPTTAATQPPATRPAATPAAAQPAEPSAAVEEPLPALAHEAALPEAVRAALSEPFKGDLDEMVERRLVRIGVTYNRTFYFGDRGEQRGIAYEYGKLMEDELNKRRKTGNLKVSFWFVPMQRDQLIPALLDGKVDMVIAQRDVDEVVVTGPGAPAIASVVDLSGQEVFVRRSSGYYQGLLELNDRLKAAGKPPVSIQEAPESLEDDDLLEMVNAGLVGITVVDDYLADFWKQVFTNLTVHDSAAVSTGGTLAVAFRKGSPQLAAGLNAIIDEYGLGTTFGNMMQKRYLQSTKFVTNAASEAERQKFLTMVELFRKYSDQYEMDYLLMAAQGFQESRLDQSVRSKVGAIGVMQVMPATGKELDVGDISQLRREAAKRGLDPNVWFGNVEQIASERIGRETVTYVSNIYKYYVAYRLVVADRERREAAKQAVESAGGKSPR